MLGVGGDTGWSRSVRPEYHVPPGTHRWALVLRPYASRAWLHRPMGVPSEWVAGTKSLRYAQLGLARRAHVRLCKMIRLVQKLAAALAAAPVVIAFVVTLVAIAFMTATHGS